MVCQRTILPPAICNLTSKALEWLSKLDGVRVLYPFTASAQARTGGSLAQALPEGPLPTEGGGGSIPALPIFLSLCFLLPQRSGDVGRLIAFVREVLVKRHC